MNDPNRQTPINRITPQQSMPEQPMLQQQQAMPQQQQAMPQQQQAMLQQPTQGLFGPKTKKRFYWIAVGIMAYFTLGALVTSGVFAMMMPLVLLLALLSWPRLRRSVGKTMKAWRQ